MKHILSTHLIANHRLTTAWLERVRKIGVNGVEIFCARQSFDYRDRAQIRELTHWFRDSELELFSLHAPMYRDEVWGRSGPHAVIDITEPSKPKRIDHVDEIKRAIEVAESIPFRFLVQHLGVPDQEWDERRIDPLFSSLEDLKVFAHQRGVTVLVENIPNGFSSAERLNLLMELTHLDLGYCFDVGHANLMEGIERAYEQMAPRIRSTHLHDNDGKGDLHWFPYSRPEATVQWRRVMQLLRRHQEELPLVLELREVEGMADPLGRVQEIFEKLESERDEEDYDR